MSNDTLNLELLTKKLCVLLALATAQRVQTFAKIEIANISIGKEAIEIRVDKRIKTSNKNRFQPLLFLPFYNADRNICPATTLVSYLDRTKEIRGETTSLLITFKKPYHSASAQTISRWLKCTLNMCGLNTNQFTAHSTRHAATSAAARKGVSIDRIRLAAGWTEKSSTFANIYKRPLVPQNNFAKTVLDC